MRSESAAPLATEQSLSQLPDYGQTLLAAVRALGHELDTVRREADPEISARLAGAEDELAAIHDEMRQQQEEIERLVNGAGSSRSAMMRRVLSSLPLATILTSSAGIILEANPAAHATMRVPPAALPGKPIFAYIAQDDRRRLRSALSQAAGEVGDELLQISATITPRRGASVPSHLTLAPEVGAVRLDGQQDDDGAQDEDSVQDGESVQDVESVQEGGGQDRAGPDTGPAEDEDEDDRSLAVFWVLIPDLAALNGPPSHQQLEALTRLCRLGADGSDLRSTLGQVVKLCLQAIFEASDASLLVGNPLEPTLAIASSATAQHLDGLQHARAGGPSFDAYRSRRPIALDAAAVAEHQGLAGDPHAAAVHSLLAVPLLSDELPTGVLTLYCDGGASVATLSSLRQVMPFVEAAQSLIRDTHAHEEMLRTQQQLEAALTSRAVIDQAKGMIMVTLKCDADEAFGHLVRMSSTRHEKVRDVAQGMVDDLVTNRSEPPGSPSE
jgi:PAS domain-containing protein